MNNKKLKIAFGLRHRKRRDFRGILFELGRTS